MEGARYADPSKESTTVPSTRLASVTFLRPAQSGSRRRQSLRLDPERREELIGIRRLGRRLHCLLPGPLAGGRDEHETEAVGPGVDLQHVSHVA
jgi:hypothetical protein